MTSTVSPPGSEFTLPWLLQRLRVVGLLSRADAERVPVEAPQQEARVRRALGGPESRYRVSAAELVASFKLTAPDGRAVDDDLIAQIVAQDCGFPYRKIDPLELDMGFITSTLPRAFATRHVVLPLSEEDGTLLVAVENPLDRELLENLARVYPGAIDRVVTSKRDILKCITDIYGFRKSVDSAARQSGQRADAGFEQLIQLKSVGEIEASDQHVVNAVDFLFRYAFDQRASDIHIEPRRNDSQVRLRIDGVLHDVHTIPRQVHPAFISRLKTIARMDIAEKRRPQDGRIKTQLDDLEVELRVSTLPVAFGEKVVIRIFDPTILLQDPSQLGFRDEERSLFERWIRAPHGMVLITGPTGSGKTTTLYTTLRELANEEVNVTSIEDPIEMVTEHFNQVQAQPRIGVDFAAALRSILRQDPDIIMIGEIRDGETAQMAVQAALTGHLVFSTLHTNDTVSAVTRMVDLGVEPFLVGSVVHGVLAQRLVRKLCEACAVPTTLSDEQFLSVGVPAHAKDRFPGTRQAIGCVECRGTGYRGRIGLFELFDVDADFVRQLQHGAKEDELRAHAKSQGLVTLRAQALRRLAEGTTSLEELIRVTGLGVR